MDLKYKFLINSMIGLVVGMIVGILIWTVFYPGNPEGRSFILHIMMSGLHGLIPVGAMTVYSIESWGLTKSTVVHALITLATVLLIELPMKWFTPGVEFAIVMVIYVIIYAIIWLINYLNLKHTINEINGQLENIHKNAQP